MPRIIEFPIDGKKKEQILRLSASKIALWHKCPMAFYLRYIDPQPDNKEAMVLTFGKVIHYMLDKFYDTNFKSPESFSNYFKYYWYGTCSGEFLKGKKKESTKILDFPMKKMIDPLRIRGDLQAYKNTVGEYFGYRKLGEKILKNFYIRHKNKPKPEEREVRRILNVFGHKVIVIFDRIDKIDNKWYVTDYKTDKHYNIFNINRNPQFTLYSKAFRQIYGTEEENILYYHLRSKKILKTMRSEKDFEYLEGLLKTTYEQIERAIDTGNFVTYYNHGCSYCDYKPGCERYSVNYGGPKLFHGDRIIEEKEFTEWGSVNELMADER